MDQAAIEKLVSNCLRECIHTTGISVKLKKKLFELLNEPICNLVVLFIKKAEEIQLGQSANTDSSE